MWPALEPPGEPELRVGLVGLGGQEPQVVALEPTSPGARRCRMMAWQKLGRLDAARREAVAVMGLMGAETAASSPAPAIAVFCTISKLARLVTNTQPADGLSWANAMAPTSLSNAL